MTHTFDQDPADNRSELDLCITEIKELQAKNKELEIWIDNLQSGTVITCVYCGHIHSVQKNSHPLTVREALRKHIEICPKHPMSKSKTEMEAKIKDLHKTIDAYRDVCNEYIPADKLDEANSKVILLAVGEQEQIGRDLLNRRPLKNGDR